jgi:hypothetical protein
MKLHSLSKNFKLFYLELTPVLLYLDLKIFPNCSETAVSWRSMEKIGRGQNPLSRAAGVGEGGPAAKPREGEGRRTRRTLYPQDSSTGTAAGPHSDPPPRSARGRELGSAPFQASCFVIVTLRSRRGSPAGTIRRPRKSLAANVGRFSDVTPPSEPR